MVIEFLPGRIQNEFPRRHLPAELLDPVLQQVVVRIHDEGELIRFPRLQRAEPHLAGKLAGDQRAVTQLTAAESVDQRTQHLHQVIVKRTFHLHEYMLDELGYLIILGAIRGRFNIPTCGKDCMSLQGDGSLHLVIHHHLAVDSHALATYELIRVEESLLVKSKAPRIATDLLEKLLSIYLGGRTLWGRRGSVPVLGGESCKGRGWASARHYDHSIRLVCV